MAKRKLKEEDAAELAKQYLRFSKRDKTRLTKPMKIKWIGQYVARNCTNRVEQLQEQMFDLADDLWRTTMVAYLEQNGIPVPETARHGVVVLTQFIYQRLPAAMVETTNRVCTTDKQHWNYVTMREVRPNTGYSERDEFQTIAHTSPICAQYAALLEEKTELSKVGDGLEREIHNRLTRIDTIGGALTLMPDLLLHISAIIEDIALETKTVQKRVVTEAMADEKWLNIINTLGTKKLYGTGITSSDGGEHEVFDEVGDREDQVDGGDDSGSGAAQEGGSDVLQDGAE